VCDCTSVICYYRRAYTSRPDFSNSIERSFLLCPISCQQILLLILLTCLFHNYSSAERLISTKTVPYCLTGTLSETWKTKQWIKRRSIVSIAGLRPMRRIIAGGTELSTRRLYSCDAINSTARSSGEVSSRLVGQEVPCLLWKLCSQ